MTSGGWAGLGYVQSIISVALLFIGGIFARWQGHRQESQRIDPIGRGQ